MWRCDITEKYCNRYCIIYHASMSFNVEMKESFREDCEEKEKMLVTCIFSFAHNVFTQLKGIFIVWSRFNLSSAFPFSFEKAKNTCLLVKVETANDRLAMS